MTPIKWICERSRPVARPVGGVAEIFVFSFPTYLVERRWRRYRDRFNMWCLAYGRLWTIALLSLSSISDRVEVECFLFFAIGILLLAFVVGASLLVLQ